MTRRPAAFLCLSALCGAYVGYFFEPVRLTYLGLALSLMAIFVPRTWARIIAFLAWIFFLTTWSLMRDVHDYERTVAKLPATSAHYRGVIVATSIKEDGSRALIVRAERPPDHQVTFSVAVYLRGAAAATIAKAGCSIDFTARVRPFLEPLSLDYSDSHRFGFVRKLHGVVQLDDPHTIVVGAPPASPPYFANLAETFRMRMLAAVSPHETALLLGLLIGDTSLFSESEKNIYRSICAQHLLAVSGLQISLLSLICFALFYPADRLHHADHSFSSRKSV